MMRPHGERIKGWKPMTEKKKRTENSVMAVEFSNRMILQEKVKCGKCGMNRRKWWADNSTTNKSEYAGPFFYLSAAIGFEKIRLPRMVRMLRGIRSHANFKKFFEITTTRLDLNAEELYTLGHELTATIRCRACGHLGKIVYMQGKPGVSGWPHQNAMLGKQYQDESVQDILAGGNKKG